MVPLHFTYSIFTVDSQSHPHKMDRKWILGTHVLLLEVGELVNLRYRNIRQFTKTAKLIKQQINIIM